ncbi:hypothetical protein PMAYCL1PPCAC_28772, partial [Pristionchus mayeri]
RLSLFITHCGQGSTIEATSAGLPLIVIPVMADQKRNAQTIARLGTGVVLEKGRLSEEDALEKAIREVLENEKYSAKAKLVREQIRRRPFSPKEIFVRNFEFMAKYGPLRQLDHYGCNLNFFVYYSIDVISFISLLIMLSLVLIHMSLRMVVCRCFRCIK